MDEIDLSSLTVIHRPKDAAGHGMSAAHEVQLRTQGLYLETCLRQLLILDGTTYLQPMHISDSELQWFTGYAAYSFLLQTATGLNSSIQGETNVMGQFLHAWRNWRSLAAAEQLSQLDGTMRRLFSDSRQIRQNFLQGIGGNSYGSLVRKLLAPDARSRILIVGTGKLAHSLRPMFDAWEIGFWNYRSGHKSPESHWRIFHADQQQLAADWATHIVLTTPTEALTDPLWAKLVAAHQTVVHLGRRRAEPGEWGQLATGVRYFDLDDVFELRSRQSTVRSLQIQRARKACEQLAHSAVGNLPAMLTRKATACS